MAFWADEIDGSHVEYHPFGVCYSILWLYAFYGQVIPEWNQSRPLILPEYLPVT